ncbi:MAG: alkaline phosphatase family protein [Planctomycetota bacterium]
MRKLLLVDVVGLTPALIGPDTPRLAALAREGFSAPLGGILPGLTCSSHECSPGAPPREHGIVGTGWYFRDLVQVCLWRQSNHLVGGRKSGRRPRARPGCTTMNMFWWYAMYAAVDRLVDAASALSADGRKPPRHLRLAADFRRRVEDASGTFPLFHFWDRPRISARAPGSPRRRSSR